MTSDQAQTKAERLSREHPERQHYHWFAKHIDGGVWTVVRVNRPANMHVEPLRAPANRF